VENEVLRQIDLAAIAAATPARQASPLTLAELVSAYSLAHNNNADQRLRKWTDAFGNTPAWSLSSETLETAAEGMLAHGYAPASINRDLSALGSAFKWARARRLTPRGFTSPTLAVRRYAEPIRRIHLADDDLQRLLTLARTAFKDPRFGLYVALLADSGARRSEVSERRFADLDPTARTLLAPTTKNGTPRLLHYSQATADLLAKVYPQAHILRQRTPEALLFPGRTLTAPNDYRASWAALTRMANLPGIHLHDLRHAAAAALLRSGVTLAVASQVLGHDAAVLSRRYGHLEAGPLREAQERAWAGRAAA
jgi:integrase